MEDENRGLILNRPYDIPSQHWVEDENRRLKPDTGRCSSVYRLMSSNKNANIEGRLPWVAYKFETVETLRDRMRTWRTNGYPGASPVSLQLLQHWTSKGRHVPLFFCQTEAIETFIYLTETKEGQQEAEGIEGDSGDIERWCAKMATGTGKTVVMAMLIAWQTLNWHSNRESDIYTRSFLAVAPGLTVKDRLSVLIPYGEGNYYDQFNLLPPGDSKDILCSHTKLLIINWHKLMWQTDEEIIEKKTVDKRGALSDKAWLKNLVGNVLPENEKIAVINDEAHHAWRIPSDSEEEDYYADDIKQATKWIEGLDRLDKAVGVSKCYDFTATPFIPEGKKTSTQEKMFSWVVSDFGLSDAIESGLVKTPRIPARDNTISDYDDMNMPDSFLYHIYEEEGVKDSLKSSAKPNTRLPSQIIDAYHLLGESWSETSKTWNKNGSEIPPVMITVANNTKTAARVENMFLNGNESLPGDLENIGYLLRIDTSVLSKAEQDSKGSKKAKLVGENLREKVRTVGMQGHPGHEIRNVISVEMLSEGWDAKNVTHIMGLRAFTSQLLCEQVIGRGLRRTDYETDENGYLKPDYVRIFGVPFICMLQQEEDSPEPSPPPPPPKLVSVDPSKSDKAIWFPDIERIDFGEIENISLQIEDIPPFILDGDEILRKVEVSDVIDWLQTEHSETITSESLENMRIQELAFKAAAKVCSETPDISSNRMFPSQLADLTSRFAKSSKLSVTGANIDTESAAKHKMYDIASHIKEAIMSRKAETLIKQRNITPIYRNAHKPLRSTSEMIDWNTRAKKTKLYNNPSKCHLNRVICDTQLERKIATTLNKHKNIDAWIKNDRDHIGFKIRYIYKGIPHDYIPDFIARTKNGTNLIIEAKGVAEKESKEKQEYTNKWIEAINAEDRWGKWENIGIIFSENIPELKAHLDLLCSQITDKPLS